MTSGSEEQPEPSSSISVYECDVCCSPYRQYDTAVACEEWHVTTGRQLPPPRDVAEFLDFYTEALQVQCTVNALLTPTPSTVNALQSHC
jgi:hypothetical protein